MIGQKRLDTNYNYDFTEWQINQDNEIDKLHNNLITIDTRVEKLEKNGNTGGTITIDSELLENSENPVQNKIITNEINHIITDIDGLTEKTDTQTTNITNINADISDIENRVTNLENGEGSIITGVSYHDSVMYTNQPITIVENSTNGENEVQTIIENAKIIPISIVPLDSSATWRVYIITGWTYDSTTNSTTIKFIATDTSTNVNIVTLPIYETN